MVGQLTEITVFKNYNLIDQPGLRIGLFKPPTFSPFPLDYRNKESLDKKTV